MIHASLIFITLCFAIYAMDIRVKSGALDIASRSSQMLMKLLSCGLIVGFIAVICATEVLPRSALWWCVPLAVGTLLVALAKRELAESHTWTGQYQSKPRLKTSGVYRLCRNPLYLGVIVFEIGAFSFFLFHRQSVVNQDLDFYVTALILVSLAYAVTFNLSMARKEARILRMCFSEEYERYCERTPFLLPGILGHGRAR